MAKIALAEEASVEDLPESSTALAALGGVCYWVCLEFCGLEGSMVKGQHIQTYEAYNIIEKPWMTGSSRL